MTDKELLELAAKGAGYNLGPEWDSAPESGQDISLRTPTDSQDAFRLMFAVVLAGAAKTVG